MRVCKDYEDYKKNKYLGENGVTQYHLDKYYGGDLELAKKDNESNMNCYNCYNCNFCYDCNNCNDSNRLYATFNSKINNKDNQS